MLSSSQTLVLGLVAMLVAWLASVIIEKAIPWFVEKVWKKPITIDLGRWIKTILVAAASILMAWLWFPVALPVFPVLVGTFPQMVSQIWDWLPLLGTSISPFIGTATLLYNLIFGYVLDPDRLKKWLPVAVQWLMKYLNIQLPPQ